MNTTNIFHKNKEKSGKIFFILEKVEKTTLHFSQETVTYYEFTFASM